MFTREITNAESNLNKIVTIVVPTGIFAKRTQPCLQVVRP